MQDDEVYVELGTGPIDLTNVHQSRYVYTKIADGRRMPMFQCTEQDGVLLQKRAFDEDRWISPLLREKKPFVDSLILPAVGVLFVLYPRHDKAWCGTAFVSSTAVDGKQRIATAFHNVLPLRGLVSEDWEWPEVIFSTRCNGTVDNYLEWREKRQEDVPNEYVRASFSSELLLQWQGCDLAQPTYRYTPQNEHDLIELEVPAIFPTHLELCRTSNFVREQVVCVGYPGEDTKPETYRSTPSYKHSLGFVIEHKTVSLGYCELVDGNLVKHSCSTVSQNSGSPIIALSDLGSGPIARVMAVHVSSPTDTDDESRNYNVAIYKNYWI
eukprot:TRINITY_DN1317_c0_g1_i3.p1 TRINITY_DN1317_c0_g1~~TRINITY_DN1317_c0_g1_i3.p1  ORF type:complete len:325 (-),score=34.88 TRINITY_DN1317_c0_g1_i3:247-1221(-)